MATAFYVKLVRLRFKNPLKSIQAHLARCLSLSFFFCTSSSFHPKCRYNGCSWRRKKGLQRPQPYIPLKLCWEGLNIPHNCLNFRQVSCLKCVIANYFSAPLKYIQVSSWQFYESGVCFSQYKCGRKIAPLSPCLSGRIVLRVIWAAG